MSLALSESTSTFRPEPTQLAARAREMLAQGRPSVARSLIAALRPAGASSDLAAEMDARLLQAQGDLPAALSRLDQALGASQCPALHDLRAGFRLLAEDYAGAARDAAEVIVSSPDSVSAKAVLGRALLRLQLNHDARACLHEALSASPTNILVRFDLIEAWEALGNQDAADRVVDEGIATMPRHGGLRSLAILRRVRRTDYAGAIQIAELARSAGALDGAGFGLLGHALTCLGEQEAAADAYVEALKLTPSDPYVRHLAAAAGRVAEGSSAPPEYVRVLFNGYADHFEGHLIHLGYRVPGLIRAKLAAASRPGPVLDLGCGTGLLGVAAATVTSGPWIGVDIAARMLDAARLKGIYAELHEADLLPYLAQETRCFPTVLAGDVLCYFGDLQPIITAVAQHLELGGRFIFSIEQAGTDAHFKLGPMGRFTHREEHVRKVAAAAGLEVVSITPEQLRQESGRPVLGYVVILGRLA